MSSKHKGIEEGLHCLWITVKTVLYVTNDLIPFLLSPDLSQDTKGVMEIERSKLTMPQLCWRNVKLNISALINIYTLSWVKQIVGSC